MRELSAAQSAVLLVAGNRKFFNYYEAASIGGNGRTLAAMVRAGLLVKNEYPDGSNDWSITDAGRAAIAAATSPNEGGKG
jgi:hypothetical protein